MTRRSLTVAVVVLVVQNTLASCPDGAQCDIEYTYCSLANGSSSCCQHPSAICCPGGNTCCLEGQACALDSCYQHVLTWPFVGYKGNQKKAVPISICGNKDHSDDELQNVVGSPRVQGREKNEYSGGSGKEDPQVGSSELQIREEVECPDKSLCPLDFTCCPAKPSGYGCCPIENAVCCSDQVHCCPANTICSSDTHECLQWWSTSCACTGAAPAQAHSQCSMLRRSHGISTSEGPMSADFFILLKCLSFDT
ncbi:progranulin-like isoform X4 [Oratosquilla oratoria]|uniref:progranulin-like isoform X4 n=1 Tax=Oratosquilla oratoria TaxID=337810 RepID=UPI003F76CE48